MILKQGHKYRAIPHDGKVIRRIYRGGRCYYKDSPYSLAATQALRAAFPQYWTAISDYGYAHPQLVPFVNEDPMLIVSLVEVGKTRWLVGDGKAYIVTDLTASENSSYKVKIQPNNPTGSFPSLFGCGKTYTTYIGGSQVNRCGKYANVFTEYRDTNEMLIYLGTDGFSVNEGALRQLTSTYISNNGGENMWIFCSNIGNGNIWSGNMAYYKQQKGDIEYAHLLPFIRNGENGMLDILSGTFHPNANTEGSFTIEITDKE